MRRTRTPDLLEAMKESLRELENLKPPPNRSEILNLQRSLKEQIAALERAIRRRDSLARSFHFHPANQNYQHDNCENTSYNPNQNNVVHHHSCEDLTASDCFLRRSSHSSTRSSTVLQ